MSKETMECECSGTGGCTICCTIIKTTSLASLNDALADWKANYEESQTAYEALRDELERVKGEYELRIKTLLTLPKIETVRESRVKSLESELESTKGKLCDSKFHHGISIKYSEKLERKLAIAVEQRDFHVQAAFGIKRWHEVKAALDRELEDGASELSEPFNDGDL